MYAIFLDHNEILRCEESNEDIWIFEKYSPARPPKKNIFGRIINPGSEATMRYHYQFNDEVYSRERYTADSFRAPPIGYVRSNHRYMKKNSWGHVKVLAFLNDPEGKKVKEALNV